MSFLNVLFGRGSTAAAPPADNRRDPAVGAAAARPASSSASVRADGKTGVDAERADRRERLYGVIRETLMRCGVLSASYKFKVLSTDARGQQFLVMLDVASDSAQLMRSAEIESMIRQAAQDQHGVDVVALYWRVNAQLASRAAPAPAPAAVRREPIYPPPAPPPLLQPAPAFTQTAAAAHHAQGFGIGQPQQPYGSQPAPALAPAPAPLGQTAFGSNGAAAGSRFEPIQAEEVDAFRKALAGRGQSGPADGVLRRSGARQRSGNDFEDTQVFAAQRGRGDVGLSATQYGELE